MKGSDPPLCNNHEGFRGPQKRPERHRCSALNARGEPCAQWAVYGTIEEFGAALCPAHLPEGDQRRVRSRLPEEDHQRRCRANTLDGERCPMWAMADGESDGLCWLHAFPHEHGRITHSYYRRVPHFSPVEHAAVRRAARDGKPLSAEVLVVRLKLRDVLVYTGRPDVRGVELDRSAGLIFSGAGAVARIVRAQKKLAEIELGPYAAGCTSQLLEQILGDDSDEPEPDGQAQHG